MRIRTHLVQTARPEHQRRRNPSNLLLLTREHRLGSRVQPAALLFPTQTHKCPRQLAPSVGRGAAGRQQNEKSNTSHKVVQVIAGVVLCAFFRERVCGAHRTFSLWICILVSLFSTSEVKERRCDCPSGPSALVITERKRGRAQSRSFLGILGQTRCFVPGGSLQDRCCVTCAQTHAHTTTTSSRPAILFSLLDYTRTRLLVERKKKKDGGCSSGM